MRILEAKLIKMWHEGWLKRRFGDHCAQISTVNTLKLASACKDVVRFMRGRVPPDVEVLTKNFEKPPQGLEDHKFVFGYEDSDNWVVGSITYDKMLQTFVRDYPEEWKVVEKCLGLGRSLGRHACGFAIANEPLTKLGIPLTMIGGYPCTAFTSAAVEAMGVLKNDFLVINSLKDIGNAITMIQRRSGWEVPQDGVKLNGKWVPAIRLLPRRMMTGADVGVCTLGQTAEDLWMDIWDLSEDQAVFKDVATSQTETVFQFNTPGAQQWLRQFAYRKQNGNYAIDDIEGMSAFTALDRPGPLNAYVQTPGEDRCTECVDGRDEAGDPCQHGKHNMLVEFARRARGAEPSVDIMPVFNKLFPETHGVMCISEGSLVKTSTGLVKIEEVPEGALVQTETGAYNTVLRRLNQGEKECVRVIMDGGEALVLTPDHRVLTHRGWVEAGKLEREDLVRQYWVSDEKLSDGDDRDWIVGLLLADGDLTADTPVVACSDEKFALSVKEIADRAWGLDSVVVRYGRSWYCRLRHKVRSGTTRNPLTTWLREQRLLGLDCFSKHFPDRTTRAMLVGFFEGDGSVLNNRLRVKNELLGRKFFEGLQSMRVQSSLREDGGVWTVSVNGPLPLRVKSSLRDGLCGYVPRPDLSVVKKSDGTLFYNHRRSKLPFISRRSMRLLADRYGLTVDPQPWGRVLGVERVGLRRVWDLSVANEHSFVTGGSVTHNCYQEQLQRLYQEVTGCTGAEAEEFRGNVAKKKKEKIIAAYDGFITGATKVLGSKEQADAVWQFIQTWAAYGFNKSHSVCYCVIAYACAYLKRHHPLEWWCAVLKNATKDEINSKFWRHCGDLIDLPDVLKSWPSFEIVDDRIQAPLTLMLGFGEGAQKELLDLLAASKPTTIGDFCKAAYDRRVANGEVVTKIKVKKKTNRKTGEVTETSVEEKKLKLAHSSLHRGVIYTLIVSGAMDSLFPKDTPVIQMLAEYEEALATANKKKKVEAVKPEYNNITQYRRYQMRKRVLPAYSEKVLKMLIERQHESVFYSTPRDTWKYRGPERVVSFATADEVEAMMASDSVPESGFRCAVPAFVDDVRVFSYSHGSRQACELMVDVDGARMKFVRWPDFESGELDPKYNAGLKGALVILALYRHRKKKLFNVDELEVVQPSLAFDDEVSPAEQSPEPPKETE